MSTPPQQGTPGQPRPWEPPVSPPPVGAPPFEPVGPQWGPPAGLGYPGPGQRQPPGVNGIAVAALVTAVVALFPISIVLAIIGLAQIRRTGQPGRGLAIAALAVSAMWVVFIAVLIAVVVIARPTTSTSSSPSSSPTSSPTSSDELRIGDCINRGQRSFQQAVPVPSCSVAHEGEVVSIFDLADGPYPGDAAIESEVSGRCNDGLDAYSPSAQVDDDIDLASIFPGSGSWRVGDREVVCIATSANGTTTGSIRGR